MDRGRGRGGRVRPANNVPAPSRMPSTSASAQQTGSSAQSVLQHDIFASTTPANGPRTTTLPPSTNYLERATRAPATGRFRPRNVRRDVDSRDELARREAEKDAKRADEDMRQSRGRFRSRRSRGHMMGWGGLDRRFAAGAGASDVQGADWKGKADGSSKFHGAAGRKHNPHGVKSLDNYEDPKPRINADRLNVHTAEGQENENEDTISAMDYTNTGTVWPMGIYRKEHKDIEFTVATTAELEAQEKDLGAETESKPAGTSKKEEDAVVDDDKPWHAAPKNLARIKKEPDEPTIIDFDSEMKIPPPPPDEPEPAQEETKPVEAPSHDTEEDMMAADLNLLAEELGLYTLGEPETETATGTDADAPGVKNKDGRLYLFQFPPVLPPLRVVPGTERSDSVVVKPEPDDAVMLEHATANAHNDKSDSSDSQAPSSKGGLVGRLNVRKSGKVEFDWGGTTLEMSPAAAMSFVTTAVIVEQSDEQAKGGGESIGMGRIMGRFVLSPVWGEEDDWDVTPADLEVDADMLQ